MTALPPALPAPDLAEARYVAGEPAELPPFSADVWSGRYVPRGILVPFRGQVGTPAPYALDTASLVVRRGGALLREGTDYVVDAVYGTLCLPEGEASPVWVTLDYRYTLLRLDSVVVDAVTGERRLRRGVSHLTNPHPPLAAAGEVVEAHVFVDDRAEEPVIYPRKGDATTDEAVFRGRLPEAARRLAGGEYLRVLFLGDSITEGGDASTDEDAFRSVAARLLRARHPGIEVHVAATGGSRSVQWLDATDETCDWRRVEAVAPHVTVVEFFNDAYLDPAEWGPAYEELVSRLSALGSEVVLLTPTFAMRTAMNGSAERDDGRPYVRFLRDHAERAGLPLIDVSARWERLRDEGLPYWTLLANGINHPDDRGHRLTGEVVARGLAGMLEAGADA